MPDGALVGGPYAVPPSSDDERISVAIRSYRPEEIFGLSWSKPNFSASDHKIVRTFSIEGKKRPGGEYIPCAMCSGKHPKFLEGAVLWSPDGWLRVIGHICAVKPEHFGNARYRILRQQRDQEHLDSVAFDWLHASVEKIQTLGSVIMKLREFATAMEQQQQIFFRDVPQLAQMLSNAVRRSSGVLTVSQELSATRLAAFRGEAGSFNRKHLSQFETISIGTMIGQDFLIRPKIKRSQQLDNSIGAMSRVPVGAGEEAMLALIERGEAEITITAGLAFRALQRALKFADECFRAQEFFSPSNLTVLENWGQDSRNPVQFSLYRYREGVQFKLYDKSKVQLSTAWPKRPDLSLLREVVAVGIQLEHALPKHTKNTTNDDAIEEAD